MTKNLPLGQLMLDIDNLSLSEEDLDLLQHPQVGGVILFSRNFESKKQLKDLCSQIHALRNPKLLISVDHEGGRVQRFREQFTELPPASIFSDIYDKDKNSGLQLCETSAWLMAVELLDLGIDFSFAPVLDMDLGLSKVIGDRALHHTVDGVTDLARAWIRGMHKAGMAAVAKHFPGHAGVKEDSHVEIPVDKREYVDLKMQDIIPFARIIESGVEAIMPAHIYYSQVDPNFPAGFSKIWLKDILRDDLGFSGTIFSDDLSMQGASNMGNFGERATQALRAGCDMVLVCNHRAGAIEALGALETHVISNVSGMRFIRLHGKSKVAHLANNNQYKLAVRDILALEHHSTLQLQV